MPPAESVERSDSASVVLRSTHILLVEIVVASPSEWQPQPRRTQQRIVRLKLGMQEVLKGEIDEAVGTTVTTDVDQIEIVGSRLFAVPGVWSGNPVTPGTQLVVCSRSTSRKAAEILREANTTAVFPAGEELEEIRWALECEKERWPLPDSLDRLAQRSHAGALSAEYLAARLGEVLYADPAGFSRLMDTLESPGFPEPLREILVRAVFSRLLLNDPTPPVFAERTIIGSFRLLALPEASALANNLVGTYLPNLLGLEGGATAKTASETFRRFPEEQAKAEQRLRVFTGPASTARLQDWLSR
jgi:hypothetical protein